jgi:adenylate cyclase
MIEEKVKHKLTAIVSADVKGYSRLLAKDEAGTTRTLNAYKEMMKNLIQQHRGRVVDAPGDTVLAEFASVIDASQCAIEIQKELKARNDELPEPRRMQFRIGINLGEVIEKEDKIFGEGINVAAGIQSLTEAGGICISGIVYDHIKTKLEFRYEYLGKRTLKTITKPVRVYRVLMEPRDVSLLTTWKRRGLNYWKRVHPAIKIIVALAAAANAVWQLYPLISHPPVEVASKKKMAFPLPDKPSIAVLPFVNMSDDPKQEYLADGLAEEIINGLSQCSHIFVIARNSSFTYKGKPVRVQQVAEELGVQYVLEGSLRKTADKVRVTAQLIDALTGRHLFSERYDRELKDILVMQDEITMKILGAVQVKLTAGEDARLRAKGTKNLEAYMKLMQAGKYMGTFNKESQALARQLAEEVIALDPQYPDAYAMLCRIQRQETILGVYKNPEEALKQAVELGKKAVALDDSSAYAHAMLAFPYGSLKEFDKAISEAEKAVSLGPNSAWAYHALGSSLDYDGRSQEAIPFLEKSIRLSPVSADTTIRLAMAYSHVGQYEKAVASFKKVLQVYGPDHLGAHLWLAGTYTLMGLEKEAQAEVAEVMRIDPKFSLESFSRKMPQKQEVIDEQVSVWRKAGLK